MECMCLECGMSIHMPEDLITMDPSEFYIETFRQSIGL